MPSPPSALKLVQAVDLIAEALFYSRVCPFLAFELALLIAEWYRCSPGPLVSSFLPIKERRLNCLSYHRE